MATVDYSPLFNSLRNAGTNMANMALKSTLMDAAVAKAGLTRDQMLANTALANSKTRLNDMKYDAVNPVIAALKGMDLNDVKVRNELVTAANGKPYLPYANVGNTGATYNRADGSVVGDVATNPLLRSAIDLNQAKTRAQMALAGLNDTKARAGGFAPRAGTSGSKTSTGRNPLDLYKSEEAGTDIYGNATKRTATDYAAYRTAVSKLLKLGLDPNDFRNHVALLSGQVGGAQQPQTSAPVQETPAAETVAPTAQPVVPQTTPQDLSQVELDTQDKILNLVRIGKMPYEEALRIAEVNGWE